MRESCTYGSARGALSNERPYRYRRRDFITLLGGAAAVWPMAARSQQPAMPVVGFLSAGSATVKPWPQNTAAFRLGLQETGFTEGRNLAIEYRWAEDRYDRLPMLASDLVQRHVAVIAASPRAYIAAKAATATIPIVFMSGADPVRTGLVASLNRPGGNLTGVTNFTGDLNAKRFGLLHDLVPQAAVIGVLSDSTNANSGSSVQEVREAAHSLRLPIDVVEAGGEREIEAAFTAFTRKGVIALYVLNGFFFYSKSERLAALAASHRIASSAEARVFVEAGGLMSYGPNETNMYRDVGRYVGRILRGEKAADLPVILPTKTELVVNLRTAKAIGLDVPPTLLAVADEVIE
jgi:putative ABC transport system substrate-binding protein